MVFGGDGLSRHEGQVVFTPGLAPGDRAEVSIVSDHGSYLRGEVVSVERAGPARCEAPCPLFERCGGCQWQHVDYAEQIAQKRTIVQGALRGLEVEEERFVAAPAPWGYRRRCRLAWRFGREGFELGFRRARSRALVDVDRCPLLSPVLEAALSALREVLPKLLAAGDRGTLVLLADASEERVQCSLRIDAGDMPDADALLLGPIVGSVVRAAAAVEEAGCASIDLHADGLQGRADAFAQANAAQDAALCAVVAEAVDELRPGRVVELHAGVGNLTRVLLGKTSASERTLTAVELDGVAAGLLRAAYGDRATIRAERAEAALVRLAAAGEALDLLVFDPPCEGCAELLGPTLTLAPSALLYVSCDPMTLARDLRRLVAGGYRIERVVGIDMMPQTYHVESVVLLRRPGL